MTESDRNQRIAVLSRRDNICFVESWSDVTPQAIKAQNPAAKVYRLYDLSVKSNWDTDWRNPSDTRYLQTPLAKATIDERDWWLRDGHGSIIKENNSTLFLDVGKPGFKEEYLRSMLERLAGKGFDGVVLDYWTPNLVTTYLGQDMSKGPRPPAYPTDRDWLEKAWKPFIQYVAAGLRSAGYRVMGNCAGEYNTTESAQAWQRTQIDGTIYEQGAVDWRQTGGAWLPGRIVERRINALANDPLEVWFANNGVKPDVPDFRQKVLVSLAMYYVGIPASQRNRSYSYANDWGVYWDTLWDFNIGTPTESAVKQTGRYFWSRKFSQGIVLLNYEASDSVGYTLPSTCRDQSGRELSGAVTVPPHSALILSTLIVSVN